jgi:hypothetical protein
VRENEGYPAFLQVSNQAISFTNDDKVQKQVDSPRFDNSDVNSGSYPIEKVMFD